MNNTNRAWHLRGTGYDALALEEIPIPRPGPREVLIRQECVTICFSSVKEIRLGADHPRLAGRDMASDPVVLGDESVGTVIEVGAELQDRFRPGEVRMVQPDLGDGRAFGYGIPGGLVRYKTIPEELCGQLLPVSEDAVGRYGYFSFPLSEPLACVEKSCSIPFRNGPRKGGDMLLLSAPSAPTVTWDFEGDGNIPGRIIAVDPAGAFAGVADALAARGASVESPDLPDDGSTFDDIVIAAGEGGDLPEIFETAKAHLATGATLTVVGGPVGDPELAVDVGAVHYQEHIVLGGSSSSLSSSYRLRSGYGPQAGDTVLLLGAGGPMGQMFVLWLFGNEDAMPGRVVCTDVDDGRLDALRRLGTGAPEGLDFEVVDVRGKVSSDFLTEGKVDYLVVLCPVLEAVKECVPFLAEGAVINCFAGMKGALLPIGAGTMTSKGLRIVGFSGLDTPSMQSALAKIVGGKVDVAPIVAAVGGFDAGGEALEACGSGTYPGKILIYNGVDAPLRPVEELTGGANWSAEFEKRFLSGEL